MLSAELQSLLDGPDGRRRARLADGRQVMLKIAGKAEADFFAAEARGLESLGNAAPLRVPEVLAVSERGIVLEDLGHGHPTTADWRHAGRGLAALHRQVGDRFGWATPGWCGDSAQDNTWHHDGYRFFAEARLLPQARRAFDTGQLDQQSLKRIETLCTRLANWLPAAAPVLLHGDLWLGNLHPCASGELALIDGAAVHYGWAECDLAMLCLFGAPPDAFFSAYQEAAGIDASWRQRAPLLNLYHLLNHLNLFGSSYRSAVLAALDPFVGA